MDETVSIMAQQAAVARLLNTWGEQSGAVVQEALAIQAIPAPTLAEQARGDHLARRFADVGLAEVHRDEVGNVYGRLPGQQGAAPALLITAHLDTVFPASTDLTTHADPAAGRIYGPGLGDNSMGLAALVSLAGQFRQDQVTPPCDIWWVATVGEEGLGDLLGIRHAVSRLRDRLGAAIVLEGIGLGWVYHAGLGVRRLRVEVSGLGGHSWLQPTVPSAIHHLVRMGAALVDEVTPPPEPRSSFNIGLIDGGTSINTRAPRASLSIDLRSVEAATLRALEQQVRRIIERYSPTADLAVAVEIVGDRPSATLSPAHPLVQAAQAVLKTQGFDVPGLACGSTDANIPLAAGIPSVCIGIATGGGVHTAGEYIDTARVAAGMRQLTLLALLAADNIERWQVWENA